MYKMPAYYFIDEHFCYFIFSLIGWILENIYCFGILNEPYSKRGFLYGPICPIYGFGALILIIFLSKYKKINSKFFIFLSKL